MKIFALQVNFKDAQTGREVRVKMVITDGATTCFYSDAGFAQRTFHAAKAKGLKVAFLPRKFAIVESYEGKTLEEIKEYELALLKQAGRNYKILESTK